MLQILTTSRLSAWSRTNRQLLKAFGIFALWAGSLYGIVYSEWFIAAAVNPLAASLATLLHNLLPGLGFASEKIGTLLRYDQFSMEIYYKCTGVYQGAGMLAAILAFPVAWRTKLRGVLLCAFALSVINIVRLISIFYVGVFYPAFVDFFHAIFWEGMMVVLAVVLFAAWALRVSKTLPSLR